MVEHIQELINKIKSDGVEVAEQQAKEIENEARQKAEAVITQAKRDAQKRLDEAKEENQKLKSKTEIALKQASRDVILSLRKEIEKTLSKIMAAEISKALTPENLSDIIKTIIQGFVDQKSTDDIKIILSNSDYKKLKDGFVDKLQHQLKKNIVLQPSGEIEKGFTISFDQGKSCFEFTDHSLTEALASSLNPEISALLKEAVTSKEK